MSGEKSQPRVGLVILGFSVLFVAITGRLVMLATLPQRAGRAAPRHLGRDLGGAARHRRPQRRRCSPPTSARLGLRRAAQDPRQGRGDRTAHRRPARSRRQGAARQARHQEGLRLGQARDHPAPAGRGPSGSAFPASASCRRTSASIRTAPAAAHVLGFANVDNVGIAGIEKYIDSQGLQDLNGAGLATAGLGPEAGRSSRSTCASSTRCATSW